MFSQGTSMSLGLVILNQENVNNEHYNIAFGDYDIAKKIYYIV